MGSEMERRKKEESRNAAHKDAIITAQTICR
jgi:hypothetical protein